MLLVEGAGKLTLLKSSVQTMPNFWMSLFHIPDFICDEIEVKMNAFLWSGGAHGKGLRWIGWKNLCVPKDFGGLGLKELKKFNLAMIAKQGWRLLTEANSLVSAVMKARYYPESSIIHAELGNNPSYVWRGIYQALSVVKAGARRKIGDGKDTRVWNVPWLPDVQDGYVRTGRSDWMSDIKVHNLMSMDEKSWDIDVLTDILCTRDVELIKTIPIPHVERQDSWYWLLDEKGVFSVKSCYRWLQGECMNQYTYLWKKIWNMKLPEKVTNFLWRLCKGCLPTNVALASRHVDVPTGCPWCHSLAETDVHVIFSCDFARTVWQNTGLLQLIQSALSDTACEMFTKIFENGSREQGVEIGMISWSIWNRRNRWVWDRINGSVHGVRYAAGHLLRDWRETQLRIDQSKFLENAGARVWSPPKAGWLKVNIDAAVFIDGSIGVGAVIRDDQARFVAARGKRIAGAWKAREAEAIGLKEALSWVIDKGYTHCIFETDSYVLAAACNGNAGEAFFGTIVRDCMHFFQHVKPVLVTFIYRSANSAAHVLAKAVYSMPDTGEWHVTPPSFLNHVLDLEMII